MAVLVDRNTRVICQGFTGAQGTFVEQGKEIILKSGLNVIPANDLSDGAEKIVKAVRGQA